MAAMKLLGDWLNGSGWTNVITSSGMASSGVADSFLKSSHLTRTRHALQVTAAALYILQHNAYSRHLKSGGGCNLSFEDWCKKMEQKQPQVSYWALVLKLQLWVLQLVHSIRTADFNKYLGSLCTLMPLFFALDHVNYARWLSVHIRDLCMLESWHPEVFRRFQAGAFVIQKTKRKFSSIALDQAHEQCNVLVKGEGGAVGLTNNANALKRWVIAGPEISRIIRDFEAQMPANSLCQKDHHDQLPSVQEAFQNEVKAVVKALKT